MTRHKSPEALARGKYAAYMAAKGTPLMVTQDEFQRLHRHLTRLHNRGMSFKAIAQSAPGGHRDTTVAKAVTGVRVTVHRDIYNDLMQAVYVEPVGNHAGRRVDGTGLRRRVQGLVANGFGYSTLAPIAEVKLQAINIMCKSDGLVQAGSVAKWALLYDKLQHADPMDYGASKLAVGRAKGVARRQGWVPTHCWDEDTIDDPCAAPEWTGQCGTVYGFRIHYRDGILPVCQACSTARTVQRKWPALAALWGVAADPGTPGRAMDPEDHAGIIAALEDGATSVHGIAHAFGVSSRTVTRMRKEMAECIRD